MLLSIFSELLCSFITSLLGFALGYVIYALCELPLTGENMFMFAAVSLTVRVLFLSVVLGYCKNKESRHEN